MTTSAQPAVECRATLVSASVTIRYAATSTAADRAGTSPAVIRVSNGASRWACLRTASTRPHSSRAAGRSW